MTNKTCVWIQLEKLMTHLNHKAEQEWMKFDFVKIEPFNKWNINKLQSEQRGRNCRAPWGVWGGPCCRSGNWYVILLCGISSPTASSLFCFLYFSKGDKRPHAKLNWQMLGVKIQSLVLNWRWCQGFSQKMKGKPVAFPSPTHLSYLHG